MVGAVGAVLWAMVGILVGEFDCAFELEGTGRLRGRGCCGLRAWKGWHGVSQVGKGGEAQALQR